MLKQEQKCAPLKHPAGLKTHIFEINTAMGHGNIQQLVQVGFGLYCHTIPWCMEVPHEK